MGPIIAVKDELFKTFRFVELQRLSYTMTCCALDCTETTVRNKLTFTAGDSPLCALHGKIPRLHDDEDLSCVTSKQALHPCLL